MAVPATIADLTTNEATNSPADSDTVTSTTRPSDYIRAHAAIIKTHTEATAEHGATGAVVGTTNTQTLTNKTLTSPAINGTVTTTGLTMPAMTVGALNGTTIPTSKTLLTSDDILDEDNMASNSATDAPSQQSLVAYVAAQIAAIPSSITADTALATTSGTTKDFTVPAGTKRITMILSGVSHNGTSPLTIRVGTTTPDATGYTVTSSDYINTTAPNTASVTTGFQIGSVNPAAVTLVTGTAVLTNISGNKWVCTGSFAQTNDNRVRGMQGEIELAGVLDIIRLTSVSGDTFDAGSVNCIYE